jgi:hypothetical protein
LRNEQQNNPGLGNEQNASNNSSNTAPPQQTKLFWDLDENLRYQYFLIS